MKICSVDMQGSDAVLCILSLSKDGLFDIHDCRQQKITIRNPDSSEDMKGFQFSFRKLLEDYNVQDVIIRERPKKGKFAGGAVGFKLESAIQLIPELNVDLVAPALIKEQIKKTPIYIDMKEAGLKKFQESAFQMGFAWLNHQDYLNNLK
ncbi:DUF3010 family protein [Endozoicomonas sp.]|uniref:DUF3010 family protein n=1 Tax=Endozoicomonas sp. TaxID=1892382 RepID=UPI002885372F|nr:DUF3010 family protein [Endozoicomonas sp.]